MRSWCGEKSFTRNAERSGLILKLGNLISSLDSNVHSQLILRLTCPLVEHLFALPVGDLTGTLLSEEYLVLFYDDTAHIQHLFLVTISSPKRPLRCLAIRES